MTLQRIIGHYRSWITIVYDPEFVAPIVTVADESGEIFVGNLVSVKPGHS